ncbi:MAG: hypothetical protein LBR06_00955 [Bacteroidales bacterium]|jgi:hypothetical protein|nr:hypothetical protein [Bacteroidales bacterium]
MRVLKILFATLLAAVTWNSNAQQLTVQPHIKLPDDTLTAGLLVRTLDVFLQALSDSSVPLQLVKFDEKAETELLCAELRNSMHGRPYLLNVAPINASQYIVQTAYMDATDNQPVIYAVFELLATRTRNSFVYSSPLLWNTRAWKMFKSSACIFHYADTLNMDAAKLHAEKVAEFDRMFDSSIKTTELFLDDNMVDFMKLVGIDYLAAYNGYSRSMFSIVADSRQLIVESSNTGSYIDFDLHELFHQRVENVLPVALLNKDMVCGAAYLYAGYKGMDWNEIVRTFKYRLTEKKPDWLALYMDAVNFAFSEKDYLIVTQFINALLIKRVMQERGIEAVKELMLTGDFRNHRHDFFRTIYKITGINEKTFNKDVNMLVKELK